MNIKSSLQHLGNEKIATIQNTYYEYKCSDYKNNVSNESVYNLLFESYGYWLGNQYVTTGEDYVTYDLLIAGIDQSDRSLVSSHLGEQKDGYYIRPVVYLSPDVDIESML